MTPNRLFFVRNNSVNLDIDPGTWVLSVPGDAIVDPPQLTYDGMLRLPSRALDAYPQCAGKHPVTFDLIKGKNASGTQWMTGAVGNGGWVCASLRGMLNLPVVPDNAHHVLFGGTGQRIP